MIIAKIACALAILYPVFIASPNKSLAGSAPDATKQEMLDQVNRLRASGCNCGRKYMPPVKPLTWNLRLEKAALAHAKDMEINDFFDHHGSNGSSVGDRADKAGYAWQSVGENIAWGYGSFKETLLGWKDSPGHCRNIMNPSYTEMGVASTGDFWVQDFGRPR